MMSRSIGENFKKSYSIFSNYLPLQIWTFKICNHDISKTITTMNFKLGQLIENDGKLIGENKKKSYFIFFELSPFAVLDFENL